MLSIESITNISAKRLNPQQLCILNEDFQIWQKVVSGPYLLLFLRKPDNIWLIPKSDIFA